MSHFTVMVFGANPEKQLAPYQENNMGNVPDEYIKFISTEAEYRKQYDENSTKKVVMPDGRLLNSWDNKFRVAGTFGTSFGGSGAGTHKVPEHLEQRDVKFTELYPTFEEFMADWCGYDERDADAGEYGYRENPNKKWDWYELGGRWTGFFRTKLGADAVVGEPGLMTPPAAIGYADQILKNQIDFDYMYNEAEIKAIQQYDFAFNIIGHLPVNETWKSITSVMGYGDDSRAKYWSQERTIAWRNSEKEHGQKWPFGFGTSVDDFIISKDDYIKNARNTAAMPFAFVKDGQWFERGEMGWWACVSNEKDTEKWQTEFQDIINSLPDDTLISLYDCHI